MKLIEINWNPTNKQLRQFGVICLFALPLLGWYWGGGLGAVSALAVAGIALAVAGVAAPRLVKPVFLALAIVATPIGMVFGEIAMVLVYFGVFLPIGLVFRAMKRDALQLRLDRQCKTYWQAKRQPDGATTYYRQS